MRTTTLLLCTIVPLVAAQDVDGIPLWAIIVAAGAGGLGLLLCLYACYLLSSEPVTSDVEAPRARTAPTAPVARALPASAQAPVPAPAKLPQVTEMAAKAAQVPATVYKATSNGAKATIDVAGSMANAASKAAAYVAPAPQPPVRPQQRIVARNALQTR